MSIPVIDIIVSTDDLLNDEDRVRWPALERIRWINEAMGAILSRRPAAFATRAVLDLVGGTYQTIPEGSSVLLDVVRNIGADGVTPGVPIRRTDRQLLDDTDPTWHTSKPKAVIKHYTFDDRVPKVFYCYPPAIDGSKVEILHAAMPAPVASDADALEIGAEYMEAVINYVCYRCNAKDGEYANAALASAFYSAFEASLGVKSQSQAAASPNQPTNSV